MPRARSKEAKAHAGSTRGGRGLPGQRGMRGRGSRAGLWDLAGPGRGSRRTAGTLGASPAGRGLAGSFSRGACVLGSYLGASDCVMTLAFEWASKRRQPGQNPHPLRTAQRLRHPQMQSQRRTAGRVRFGVSERERSSHELQMARGAAPEGPHVWLAPSMWRPAHPQQQGRLTGGLLNHSGKLG